MAILHPEARLSPSKLDVLARWMPRQRWFADKTGGEPSLRYLGGYRIDDPAGEVGVEVLIVADDAPLATGGSPVTYQVPLTYRGREDPALAHALLGVANHSVLGTRWIYDAPHDPVFAAGLLGVLIGTAAPQAGRVSETPEPRVVGHTLADRRDLVLAQHGVLRGEQSNTSMILQVTHAAGGEADPVMVKLFRVLAAGSNPDVEVAGALTALGSPVVPPVIGSIDGAWQEATSGAEVTGQLAFAQTFLPGVEDAWRVATRAAAAGEDFTAPARELGEATARLHTDLARALGRTAVTETEKERLLTSLRRRAQDAQSVLGDSPQVSDAVEHLIAELDALSHWPDLQRIHGDYHLGQVLRTAQGWVAIDFEGEPLRPLAERSLPDLALRDVAGMLRSFDYAGGSAELTGLDARAWVAAARQAFLAGYAPGEDHATALLLGALELDKALYEAVYEARNRPDWLEIPRAALRRLLTGTPDPESPTTDGDTMSASPRPRVVDHAVLGPVARGEYPLPHDVLGVHLDDDVATFRTRRPLAQSVTFLVADPAGGEPARLEAEHEVDGIWVAAAGWAGEGVPDYRVEVTYDGVASVVDEPYRFWPTVGEMDLYLIGEGRHERLWDALGSHVRTYPSAFGEVSGVSFAVWAPNASAVRVVTDSTGWDGSAAAMRSLGGSGVWELFLPGARAGHRYKYEIRHQDGSWHQKADPMARATETPPATASVVTDSDYTWNDDAWMTARAAIDQHNTAMSVYEVHLGSWKKGMSYRRAAEELVEYVTWLGFTHVEFMPLAEHPFGGSWGYQVTSYYAPSARFGNPDELRYLIDRLHQAGIGVILDWVPAHFPKDDFALARFDGTALYEHPDPRRGEQMDWGTYVFNFGRTEVRNFLVANASYWLQEFHVDGLRVDAVASMLYLDYSRKDGEWEPNMYGGRENLEAISLLQEANAVAYRSAPGVVMIAEESTSFPGVTRPTDHGGLGFGFKWNMGWMNDTLRYIAEDPVNRRYHHGELTFSLIYAFSEQFILPFSHDEVVHGKGSLLGKMPGDHRTKLAGVRGLLAYQWSHPGKQLLFMGQEFAQGAEWNEERGLDWWHLDDPGHRGVTDLVRRMNAIYAAEPALWGDDHSPAGFQWLDSNDGDRNALVYLRRFEDRVIVCVQSFAGATHEGYRIPLPSGGTWREVLNTDAEEYGGYGVGNLGAVQAQETPHYGQPYSADIRLPALGAVWLVPEEQA